MARLCEPYTEELCSFTDVTLIVGDDDSAIIHIKVSSAILAMASPVFRAMFSGKYAEGKQPEIKLKDDNPIAMLHLCKVLHLQSVDSECSKDQHKQAITNSCSILDFAIVADKYDCIKAVTFYADSTLATCNADEHYQSVLDLVATAYLLDQPSHFKRFTTEMVLLGEFPCTPKIEATAAEAILPPCLMSILQAQYGRAISEVISQISLIINTATEISNQVCGFQISYKAAVTTTFHLAGLWPLKHTTGHNIRTIIGRLENLDLPMLNIVLGNNGVPAYPYPHGCSVTSTHFTLAHIFQRTELPTHRTVNKIVSKLEEICVGICLDSIKTRADSDGCRVPLAYPWTLWDHWRHDKPKNDIDDLRYGENYLFDFDNALNFDFWNGDMADWDGALLRHF